MENVRYGIIGFGAHAEQCYVEMMKNHQVPHAVIGAISDPIKEKLDYIKPKLDSSVRYFLDYKDMLDSGCIDAVIITAPHPFHPQMVQECLKRNIPVMCEKPAGVHAKQVKEMIEASKHSKALFGMMFNQRTNCLYRKMKEIISKGKLGEIQRINWIITSWYRPQKYYEISPWRATWKGEGGSIIINQASHQIDLLQWIIGMMPETVNGFLGYGRWHDIECEDEVTAFFKYKNGATGVFITSTGEYPGSNRLEISGTRGKLLCENDKLLFYELEEDSKIFSKKAPGPYDKPKYKVIEPDTDKLNLQHVGIMINFTNAILGKEKLKVLGPEGLAAVEIINAIQYSGWHDGVTTKIPVDEELYYKELQEHIKNSKKNK